MCVGGVAADYENAFGVFDVVVAGRRRIRAQRLFVAGDGATHAKAGIGVYVVSAQQTLGEFVKDVVVLGEQLA